MKKLGLLLGAGAAALVGLFVYGGKANAGALPTGFVLPKNATRLHLAAVNGGIAIDVAEWPAEPGQPQGMFDMMWDPADPQTFVGTFTPAGGTSQIMTVGKNQNSQLLLATLPGIIARSQQAKGR